MAEQNPYDFILNSGNQAEKNSDGVLPSPRGKTRKLALIFGGGVALIVGLVIALTLLFGGSGVDRQQLLKLAQRHAEIIRVADMGVEKSRNPEVRNLAITTKLSMQSSQNRLMTIVQRTGEVSREELAAGHNPQIVANLEAAERDNRFDEAFVQTLAALLNEHRSAIKAAHEISVSAANRQVYEDILRQLDGLLAQPGQN